jgi:exosortase
MSVELRAATTDAGIARAPEDTNRHAPAESYYLFGLIVLLSLAAFWPSIVALAHAAVSFDFCSQILVAPVTAVLLVYWRRRRIFRAIQGGYAIGGLILLAGVSVYWLGRHDVELLGSYDSLSLSGLGIVTTWIGGFYLAFGGRTFRAAAFPLGFLLATIPIPTYLLNRSIFYLQAGSAVSSALVFQVSGIPVVRQGFLLYLPGLTIEVAKECSSIRSSIALVITCLLAGYLFLRSNWKRLALVLFALPLSVFKNAVRIVTLSILSIYVNPAFMTSTLHRDGGILFYLLAIAILFPLFRWFEKTDRRREAKPPSHETALYGN